MASEPQRITRRGFMGGAGWAVAGVAAGRPAKRQQRPNILFIFADQLRAQTLPCYGGPNLRAPHLDRLAREGVRFDNALSIYPVCSPFRAMLMTGMAPMRNGTVANDTAVRGGLPTIGRVCRAQGYRTGYIGKWHLENHRRPFVARDRRLGFDYWAVRNCNHNYHDSFYCGATPKRIPLPGYEPFAQTDLAEDFIEREAGEPFCLFVSLGTPHPPYPAPEAYMQRYPADSIELRPNVGRFEQVERLLETDPSEVPEELARRRRIYREACRDEATMREWIQGYLAHTEALDACVGRMLAALERAGAADDTIVVFTSDHGDMLGSHGMASKQMPHEESIRIPLLMRYPKGLPENAVTDVFATPMDFFPSLCGLAGLDCPATLDGVDVMPAATGRVPDRRGCVPIMKLMPGGNPWLANGVTPWRGVRTRRYTYARLLDRGPWALFDNEADPYQTRNLIGDPAHAHLRAELDAELPRQFAPLADPMTTEGVTAVFEARRGA